MQNEIERLIELFASLPSIGKKTATRIALDLITNKKELIPNFINSLDDVAKNIKSCNICHNIDIINPCNICISDRNPKVLCIVESVADLWTIESSNIFTGKYHILGGSLSAIKGIGPDDLNLASLNKRLDGQTTGFFLSDLYQDKVQKISKLGYGLPLGSEIGYLDEGTLNAAFESRKAV